MLWDRTVDYRLSYSCVKYKLFQHVFENKNVSIKLRSKLFDSSILLYVGVWARNDTAYELYVGAY